jgi:oligopeptide/dipeptide ABC transporter ATP-binding protein
MRSPGGALLPVLSDVRFDVAAGEAVGLVGESGSGKTITALALVGLLPAAMHVTGGAAHFQDRDLLALRGEDLRAVRGAGIGFVFQEPASALSPVFTIGDQVAEALVVHGRASWPEARRQAIALLDAARIPDAARRAREYPHQLSGGLRQRAMIAIALACDPPLLVADEPTTALDPTVQAEVLDLLDELREQRGLGLLLVTHDLGIVASRTHRVAVMYAGRIVEQAPVAAIFAKPCHPYTRALLAAAPGFAGLKPCPTGADDRESERAAPDVGQGFSLAAPDVGQGFSLAAPDVGQGFGLAAPDVGQGFSPAPGSTRRLPAIEGTVPPLAAMPPGCAFEPRCSARTDACRLAPPPPVRVADGHEVACVLARLEGGDIVATP